MPDNDHNTVITELSDVQVETLGLVTQGANREEFFLLKSDTTAENQTTPETNLWTRFLKLFQKTVDTEMAELAKTEAEVPEPATETPEPEVVLAEPAPDGITIPEGEITEPTSSAPMTVAEVTPELPAPVVEPEPEVEASEPQTSNLEATMEDTVEKAATELEGRLAELEKANAALVAEVEKAREERDRETYIAKANSFAAIPVAPVELGEQLHALAKWDAKRLSFWTDLLKSIDALAADAELFIEKGTAFTPEQPDALAVIAKADDPKAEILKLSRKDAEAYLRSVRSRAKSAQEG